MFEWSYADVASQALWIAPTMVLAPAVYLLARYLIRRFSRSRIDRLPDRHQVQLQDAESVAAAARRKLSRGTIIIEVIHDIGDAGSGGAETSSGVTFDEAFQSLDRIRAARPTDAIAVVLHTLGGYTMAAEMIASALRFHEGPTMAYIPYVAMAGGTMMALATDRVVFGKHAGLGPIDLQHGRYPNYAYQRLRHQKDMSAISDEHLMRTYVLDKSERAAREDAGYIVNPHHQQGWNRYAVMNELASIRYPQGKRITFEMAQRIGIRCSEDCPPEVYDLVDARLRILRTRLALSSGTTKDPAIDVEASEVEDRDVTRLR